MIRRSLAALSLGLLVAATAQPAKAEANLFEPLHNTFTAQTFHRQQPAKEDGKRGTIWLGGEYRNWSVPLGFGDLHDDAQYYRGGIGYAQDRWQIGASFGNLAEDIEGFGDIDTFVWDVNAKWNFWGNGTTNLAAVFNFRDFEGDTQQIKGLLAAEHRFTRDISGVVNLGYGVNMLDFGNDECDFLASVGLLWHPAAWRRFSLGLDYSIKNDVDLFTGFSGDGYDNWSAKAGYFVTNDIQVTAGGGKRTLFFVGVNGRIR